MKQIAVMLCKDGSIKRVRVKKNAVDFTHLGGTYNAGPWKLERTIIGPRLSALYVQGYPNPIQDSGRSHSPEEFTATDYETLHGEPVIRWLTNAMKNASGQMIWIYIQTALSGGALLASVYVAWAYHSHPWK